MSAFVGEVTGAEAEPNKSAYVFGELVMFDVFARRNSGVVIIESEMRRPGPVHNVIKAVRWAQTKHKQVQMVHLFESSYFSEKTQRLQKEFAKFVGQLGGKALPNFDYEPIDFGMPNILFRHPKRHAKEIMSIADKVGEEIEQKGLLSLLAKYPKRGVI